MLAGYHLVAARWLLDDPCISLRAHASTGDGAAAVARACGMWEYSEAPYYGYTYYGCSYHGCTYGMWEYSEAP